MNWPLLRLGYFIYLVSAIAVLLQATARAATDDTASTTSIQVLEYESEIVGSREKSSWLVVEVNGPITKDAPDRLRQRLDQAAELIARRRAKPIALPVYLRSPGGNVLAALEMGKMIRERSAEATVPYGAKCSSACTLVLAGGVRRSVYAEGAAIGIHRPFFPSEMFAALDRAEARAHYEALTKHVKQYLRDMGMSERLFERMLRTPSNKMDWLNADDARDLGLIGEDPAFAEWVRAKDRRRRGGGDPATRRHRDLPRASANQDAGGPVCESDFQTIAHKAVT
ncbi:MAG: ATP-dependent Clp protease proteolytic subunit, partial [Burkholderiaceae bacterium]